jgi:hypothetical protein
MTCPSRATTVVRTIALRSLLLAAMPMAAVAVVSCAGSRASYTIRVVNQDSLPLDSVIIAGGGAEARFGSILPGREARRTFTLDHDALLFLTGLRGQLPVRVIVGAYVSRGPAARADVVVTRGGELQVGTPVPQ